jgi:hypothetical protein
MTTSMLKLCALRSTRMGEGTNYMDDDEWGGKVSTPTMDGVVWWVDCNWMWASKA